jgi:hypothetical protein
MANKDEVALRKAALLKAARSMVRLRHSLAADEELNIVLPALENEFAQRVNAGELPDAGAMLQRWLLDGR